MGLLLSLLTQDQNLLQDPNSILPLVFLKNKKTDLPSLYLILSTMRNQCMSQAEMTNLFLTYILLDNTIEDKNEGNDVISTEKYLKNFRPKLFIFLTPTLSVFQILNDASEKIQNWPVFRLFANLFHYLNFAAIFRRIMIETISALDQNYDMPFLRNEFRNFLNNPFRRRGS